MARLSRPNARSFQKSATNGRSRWGEDMKKCVWVRPRLVAQIEFLEWTDADYFRHSKFVGLRENKNAQKVVRELATEQ
jgi:ATP-dependent DNA ligase